MGQADEVEVRTRFDGGWVRGFELHDVDPDDGDARFRVRRQSDGVVLPEWFRGDEIRPPQTPRQTVDAVAERFLSDHQPRRQ